MVTRISSKILKNVRAFFIIVMFCRCIWYELAMQINRCSIREHCGDEKCSCILQDLRADASHHWWVEKPDDRKTKTLTMCNRVDRRINIHLVCFRCFNAWWFNLDTFRRLSAMQECVPTSIDCNFWTAGFEPKVQNSNLIGRSWYYQIRRQGNFVGWCRDVIGGF